jgi:hypothetical protein
MRLASPMNCPAAMNLSIVGKLSRRGEDRLCSPVMEPPTKPSKIDSEPVVATWELWTVAKMLVSARGEGAEAHAQARLNEARAAGDEASEIVWSGVVTQLGQIRQAE